jgi:hypothetical protein
MGNKLESIRKKEHSGHCALAPARPLCRIQGRPASIGTAHRSQRQDTHHKEHCSVGQTGATVAALAGKIQIPGLPNKKQDHSRVRLRPTVNKQHDKPHAVQRVVSGSRRCINKFCALLGFYAAYNGNSAPTFRDNLLVPSSSVKPSKKAA